MRNTICVILLVAVPVFLWSQEQERDNIRWQRTHKIDYYHLSGGFLAHGGVNGDVGIQLSSGFGTHRNLLNMDYGVRYMWLNPLNVGNAELLSQYQLPLFLSGQVNVARMSNSSLFVGGEVEYVLSMLSWYRYGDGAISVRDKGLNNDHWTVAVCVGMRMKCFELAATVSYDLGPAFNQKYVFESREYDYESLRQSLRARYLVGLSLLYHFAL